MRRSSLEVDVESVLKLLCNLFMIQNKTKYVYVSHIEISESNDLMSIELGKKDFRYTNFYKYEIKEKITNDVILLFEEYEYFNNKEEAIKSAKEVKTMNRSITVEQLSVMFSNHINDFPFLSEILEIYFKLEFSGYKILNRNHYQHIEDILRSRMARKRGKALVKQKRIIN